MLLGIFVLFVLQYLVTFCQGVPKDEPSPFGHIMKHVRYKQESFLIGYNAQGILTLLSWGDYHVCFVTALPSNTTPFQCTK